MQALSPHTVSTTMMTESQRKAMAAFHRKAEKAYAAAGQIEQSEKARKMAEKMGKEGAE